MKKLPTLPPIHDDTEHDGSSNSCGSDSTARPTLAVDADLEVSELRLARPRSSSASKAVVDSPFILASSLAGDVDPLPAPPAKD